MVNSAIIIIIIIIITIIIITFIYTQLKYYSSGNLTTKLPKPAFHECRVISLTYKGVTSPWLLLFLKKMKISHESILRY